MKYVLPIVIFILCFPALSDASDTKSMAQEKAQQAIDACWAISEDDVKSGITAKMRQGTINSSNCMENHVIDLAQNYLYPKSPSLLQETQQELKAIRTNYFEFYWNLYNKIDSCRPSCGTMHYVRSDIKYAKLLESIIHDTYMQIELSEQSYR